MTAVVVSLGAVGLRRLTMLGWFQAGDGDRGPHRAQSPGVLGQRDFTGLGECLCGVQLLVFNVVALEVFRRSGFVALYGFRVGYYLSWHVIWSHFRLPLLFESAL